MVTKIIEIHVVDTCRGCPYCQYDSYYNMGQDSGWDCNHDDAPRGRIADDTLIEKHTESLILYDESQKTLLPMSKEDIGPDPLIIPKWCPLPNA